MPLDPEKHKILFRTGLALIVINTPLGWGGAAFCACAAGVTKNKAWLSTGLWIYGLSWVVFAIGFGLAGHTGIVTAKRFWHRRRRLNALRQIRAERRARKAQPHVVGD